jgi:ParB family transcriptional regulator, chromosome partitioning protein
MTSQRRSAPLGRGLAALLGDAKADTPGIRNLPIGDLEPGPFQPRQAFPEGPLQELAASIRSQGLLQPILVRTNPDLPGRFQIVGGERRWRAAQLVPLHEVPVLIRDLSDRDALAAALVENLQRQDLDPLEEAQGYQRLLGEFGLTQEALGEVVGKSRSHVANTLRLLGLPSEIRAMVRAGRISAGHARALLTVPDPVTLAQQIVEKGLNVRQTEALAAKPAREPRELRPRDPEIEALSRRLAQHLGLGVTIRADGSAGEVVIRFRDLDQLDALVRLLNGM